MKKKVYFPSMVQAITVLTVLKMMTKAQTTCNQGMGRIMYERLPNQQLQGFDDDVVRDTAPPFAVLEKCQDLCSRDRNSGNIVRECASFDFQPGGRVAAYSGGAPEYEESTCYLTREQAAPEGIGQLMLVPNSVHFVEVCISSNRPERECPMRRYVFERHPRKKLKMASADMKEMAAANRSECEERCLNEFSFVCRSVTWHSSARTCSLSRFTRRTHPELLVDDPDAEYLENTCLNAERRCDGLAVFIKEENKRLGGPFEVDFFTNMTLEECQAMCLRAEKYFCRSIEFDEMTKQCTISEEDSISQKDDISISSSPTHHFYDLVCLDNRGRDVDDTYGKSLTTLYITARGSEYPDNSVTSHLFSNGRRADTAFQRYRNSRLGGEFHSEITGRSLSECLDECLRQTSFQCRSAVYSDRFRTCRLSRYNQRDGMRIIYDADYDYYENLMHHLMMGIDGDTGSSSRPDLMGPDGGRPYGPGVGGTGGPGGYPSGAGGPSGGDRFRPGGDRMPDRYPTRYPSWYPAGNEDRYPSGGDSGRPGDYGGRPSDRYPSGGDRHPMGGYDRYPSGGDRYMPSGPGGRYPDMDRYPSGGDRYGGGGGGGGGGGSGGRYPAPGGDRYPPPRGDRYPPPGMDRHPPPGMDRYPPGPDRYPPPGGDRYPPSDRYPDDRYPSGPGGRPPPGGSRYPPPGKDRYPPRDEGYSGGRHPVGGRPPGGDRLPPNEIDRYPGGGRYPDRYGGGMDDRYGGGGSGGGGGGYYMGGGDRYGGGGGGGSGYYGGDRGGYDDRRGGGGGGGYDGGRWNYGGRPSGQGYDGYGYDGGYGGPGGGGGGYGDVGRPYNSRCDDGDNFKQAGARQRLRRQFIRRFSNVGTLELCQRECAQTKDFVCRSFNYRDTTVAYEGNDRDNCELSDRDTRDLELNNPSFFETVGTFDFYERSTSRNGADGDCLDVSQECNEDGMTFTLRTPEGFLGRIYTYGFYDRCFFRGTGGNMNVLRISGAQGYPECGTQRYGDTMTNIVVVQFSDYVQTGKDKRFNLTCLFRGPGEAVVTSGYIGAGSGSPIPIEYLPAENTLSSKIRLMILYQGRPTTTIAVGDPLTFRLESQDGNSYGQDLFATNVVARDPYSGRSVQLIDRYGCPVDSYVFPELDRGREGESLEARFNAFKIPESNFLVFEATVKTCREGCQPAYCTGNTGRSEPSFGRRRRRSLNETLDSDNLVDGNTTIVVNGTFVNTNLIAFNDTETEEDEENIDPTENPEFPEHVREMIEVFDSREELQMEARRIVPLPETICLTTNEYHGFVSAILILIILLVGVTVASGLAYRKYWTVMGKNYAADRRSPTTSSSGYPSQGRSNISFFATGNLQKPFANSGLARVCEFGRSVDHSSNPGGGTFDDPSEPIYTDPSLFERSRSLRSISVSQGGLRHKSILDAEGM